MRREDAKRALTESPGRCEPGRTLICKWSVEGIAKGFYPVAYDGMAAVTSRGYVGILKSVCTTQIEVAPRVYFNYSPSVEHLVLLGASLRVSAIVPKGKEKRRHV